MINWGDMKFWGKAKADSYLMAQAEGAGDGRRQDVEDDQKIDYNSARNLYLANPMARKIVDKPIEYAMGKRPEVLMTGCPDELIKECWREWDKLRCDEVIRTAQRNKKIYGAAAIILGIEGLNSADPATPQVVRSFPIWFNAADAMQMAGNIFDTDINSREYGRIKTLNVAGRLYPRGRYLYQSNGEMLWLDFESSNFNFAGRSVYRSIVTPLESYKESFKTFGRIARWTGVVIHKQDAPGLNAGLSHQVRAENISALKQIDAESVVSVGLKDSVENLQFDHVEDAMKARQAIIEDIASGAGVPSKLLLEDSFASLMSSGSEDFKAVIQWIEAYQRNELEPWIKYLWRVILARVTTEQKYYEYQAKETELSGVMHSQALTDWMDSMQIQWPTLIPQTEEEKQESKAKKLESITTVYQTTKDTDWFVGEVNALELFTMPVNEFEAAPDPLPFAGVEDEQV